MSMKARTKLATLLRQHAQGLLTLDDLYHEIGNLIEEEANETPS